MTPRSNSQRVATSKGTGEVGVGRVRLGNFSLLLILGVGLGVWAWLIDRLTAGASLEALDARIRLRIALCQFFASVLVGGLAGAVAGSMFAVSLGNTPWVSAWARLKARNVESAERQLGRAARIYAACTLLIAACVVVFFSTPLIVVSIARPRHVAWALVALLLLLALGALLSFTFAREAWLSAARLASRSPAGRWLFRSTLRSLLPLAAIALVLLAVSLPSLAPLARASDLRLPVTVVAALVASAGSIALLRRAAVRWLNTAFAAIVFTACVGGAGAGFALQARSGGTARAIVQQTSLSALGISMLSAALDLDGDGHVNGFGDSDCAPRNAQIHPGALELADNGIDEDCDGRDLESSTLLAAPGRHDYPIPEAWPRHPSIYLVTVDAFAPMALSAYGSAKSHAPFIDSLIERSLLFDEYFVQGPSTRLSLPALFTSRFDSEILREVRGRHPFELSPLNLTLAEVLGEAGYQTLAVLPNAYFVSTNWPGLTQGFNTVDETPAHVDGPASVHTARLVTERAIELCERARPGPRFLWVHYFDAHPPHFAPDGTRGLDEKSAYLAEVRHVDTQIERLLTKLTELDPHGVFVVTGDHAIAFDDARHRRVHYAYDLSSVVLRVPLVVYASFLDPGRVSLPVSSLDLAPTLANLAGVGRPLPFRGQSLVPELAHGQSERPRWIFSQFYLAEDRLVGRDPLRMVAVRDEQYSMILDRRSGQVEAWTYRTDPFETRDRWFGADASTRKHLDDMKRALDGFVSATHTAHRAASLPH